MSQIRELAPTEGRALVEGGALLLDVREQDEWDAGHATDASHIPLTELESRVAEVPADRPIVVICRSGARSLRAAEYLTALGHEAHNLAGGSRAWVEAGLPFVTDTGDPGVVV
jgi:rhodanese-related sulfurtransferase